VQVWVPKHLKRIRLRMGLNRLDQVPSRHISLLQTALLRLPLRLPLLLHPPPLFLPLLILLPLL
jgi:hypothetical protein